GQGAPHVVRIAVVEAEREPMARLARCEARETVGHGHRHEILAHEHLELRREHGFGHAEPVERLLVVGIHAMMADDRQSTLVVPAALTAAHEAHRPAHPAAGHVRTSAGASGRTASSASAMAIQNPPLTSGLKNRSPNAHDVTSASVPAPTATPIWRSNLVRAAFTAFQPTFQQATSSHRNNTRPKMPISPSMRRKVLCEESFTSTPRFSPVCGNTYCSRTS